jgi:hypothetical protein
MKRRSLLAALALATLLLTATGGQALAQFPSQILISVYENGNGTIIGFAGLAPLPSALLPDPGPGGLPAALTYGLLNPPGLVAGDLILLEPSSSGLISDIIRFNPNQNGGSLVFYSDNADGADSLADTGFPTALYANNLTVTEVGAEGFNGFTYIPTAGQPGFVAGAAVPAAYVIHSDVPEPGPMVLGGVAVLIGLGAAWVRRKRKPVAA